MKIYSDTLTRDDLYAALPDGVMVADIREIRNPRKRARGWQITLEGYAARHTRRRNSGTWGAVPTAGEYGYAATWDDHGVWMAALYEIDPLALIAEYANRDDFYESTEHAHAYRSRSPWRTVRDNSQAPWLETVDA